MVSIGGLLAVLIALTVAAGPVTRVLSATSAQLFNPAPYIEVVLTTPGKKIKSDYDAANQTKETGATGQGAAESHDSQAGDEAHGSTVKDN